MQPAFFGSIMSENDEMAYTLRYQDLEADSVNLKLRNEKSDRGA